MFHSFEVGNFCNKTPFVMPLRHGFKMSNRFLCVPQIAK